MHFTGADKAIGLSEQHNPLLRSHEEQIPQLHVVLESPKLTRMESIK